MRVIELNATNWKTVNDYCDALRAALGTPEWHGSSVDAFLDTMIWHNDINEVNPPYIVRIEKAKGLPREILDEIEQLSRSLSRARAEFQIRRGGDVDVKLEIVS